MSLFPTWWQWIAVAWIATGLFLIGLFELDARLKDVQGPLSLGHRLHSVGYVVALIAGLSRSR